MLAAARMQIFEGDTFSAEGSVIQKDILLVLNLEKPFEELLEQSSTG